MPGVLVQYFLLFALLCCTLYSANKNHPHKSCVLINFDNCHLVSHCLRGAGGCGLCSGAETPALPESLLFSGYYKRPVFEWLPTSLITVVREIAKTCRRVCLCSAYLVNSNDSRVSFGKSFRSDLILTKLLNCLRVLLKHFLTWWRDALVMEDDVSQAEITLFTYFPQN